MINGFCISYERKYKFDISQIKIPKINKPRPNTMNLIGMFVNVIK